MKQSQKIKEMTHGEKLLAYVARFVMLTDEQNEQLLASFSEQKVKKKQFIAQPGFTAKYRNFVTQGIFRAYVVDEDGKEQTIQFAPEGWWVSDFNSYIYQKPATMFIVALEDSVILKIDHDKEQQLKKSNHTFETLFRIMAEKGLAFEHRRIIDNLTQSAEERYKNFLTNFPHIAQRVPQYALASYLGVTTEFLSRLRNKKPKIKS